MISKINEFKLILLESNSNLTIEILDIDGLSNEFNKDNTIVNRIRYCAYNDVSWSQRDVNPYFIVLKEQDKVIGVAKVGYYSMNAKDKNDYSISYFSIDKNYRYKGYSRLMCDALFKYAKEKNYSIRSSAYTMLGKAQLEKLFIEYAQKYHVDFETNLSMHDNELSYTTKNGKMYHKDEVLDELDENLNESNISPLRFRESDINDIIDFIEELLYNSKNIDITEKIAGQHLTVNIKNGFVTVNNKDSLLHGTGDKDARHTKYGSEITRALIKYLQINKLPDQVWAFEIVNPKFNHDYINYKNQDIIFIEYTGNLSDSVANDLRKNISVRLLTKNDIKINIDKNQSFNDFKNDWENNLKRKYTSLDPKNKSRYYYSLINELKYKIGDLLEKILVSVVDKKSPVEGIVINTKTPIKLQTNNFLKVQRVQMSLYSIMKISKDEIDYVLNNPNEILENLKQKYNLEFSSMYKGDLNKSLYDIVKQYLENNNKLANIDTDKYKRWMDEKESNYYLSKLNRNNIAQIYKELYNKIKQ